MATLQEQQRQVAQAQQNLAKQRTKVEAQQQKVKFSKAELKGTTRQQRRQQKQRVTQEFAARKAAIVKEIQSEQSRVGNIEKDIKTEIGARAQVAGERADWKLAEKLIKENRTVYASGMPSVRAKIKYLEEGGMTSAEENVKSAQLRQWQKERADIPLLMSEAAYKDFSEKAPELLAGRKDIKTYIPQTPTPAPKIKPSAQKEKGLWGTALSAPVVVLRDAYNIIKKDKEFAESLQNIKKSTVKSYEYIKSKVPNYIKKDIEISKQDFKDYSKEIKEKYPIVKQKVKDKITLGKDKVYRVKEKLGLTNPIAVAVTDSISKEIERNKPLYFKDDFKRTTKEVKKYVAKKYRYSPMEQNYQIQGRGAGYETRTGYYLGAFEKGVTQASTDIAEKITYKDTTFFAKAKDPTYQYQDTSKTIGKITGKGARLALYAVPVVGESLIYAPFAEKALEGNLKSYAKKHPLQTTLAGGIAIARIGGAGYKYLTKKQVVRAPKPKATYPESLTVGRKVGGKTKSYVYLKRKIPTRYKYETTRLRKLMGKEPIRVKIAKGRTDIVYSPKGIFSKKGKIIEGKKVLNLKGKQGIDLEGKLVSYRVSKGKVRIKTAHKIMGEQRKLSIVSKQKKVVDLSPGKLRVVKPKIPKAQKDIYGIAVTKRSFRYGYKEGGKKVPWKKSDIRFSESKSSSELKAILPKKDIYKTTSEIRKLSSKDIIRITKKQLPRKTKEILEIEGKGIWLKGKQSKVLKIPKTKVSKVTKTKIVKDKIKVLEDEKIKKMIMDIKKSSSKTKTSVLKTKKERLNLIGAAESTLSKQRLITQTVVQTKDLQLGLMGGTINVLSDKSKTKTIVDTKQKEDETTIQVSDITTDLDIGTMQIPQQKTSPAITQRTITESEFEQLEQVTMPMQIQTTPSVKPPQQITTPAIITRLPLLVSPKKKKPSAKKVRQAFEVLVKRGGEFKVISKKALPKGKALKLGAKRTRETLAATFKIRKKGTTSDKDILFRLSEEEFRAPKSGEKLTFIERKERRLKKGTKEIPEILTIRKGKSNSGFSSRPRRKKRWF